MTVISGSDGSFRFVVSFDLIRNRLYVLVQAIVGNVKCRLLLSRNQLAALAGGGSGGAAEAGDIVIDPVAEASSRLLETAGANDFSDDGIDAVIAAVEAANAATDFEGLTVAQANDQAEMVASNDPTTQMVLHDNLFTPTPTPTVTPTPTRTPIACIGDCDGDGRVTVDELVKGVNIALATAGLELCPAFDADNSATVTVDELVKAVNNALNGCTTGSAVEVHSSRG